MPSKIDRVIIQLLSLVTVFMIFFLFSFASVNEQKPVELTIYNPYMVSASILVKCDWNNNKKLFMFKRRINIDHNKATKIFLPAFVKKCQAYPKIKFF